MSTSAAYRIGKFLGRFWVPVLASVLGLSALVLIAKGGKQMSDSHNKDSVHVARTPKEKCAEDRPAMIERAATAASGARFSDAREILWECANLTNDQDLKMAASGYEAKHLTAILLRKETTTYERASVAQKLWNEYDEESKKLQPQIKAAIDAQEKIDRAARIAKEKQEAAERLAIAKRKKSEGVTLGMTREDVLASSWGKPESISRTQYKWGLHEQWVYGNRNYLYFKDGILETIQN